jgi:thiol-disulfide isomerase/thioredoxin
MLLALTIAVVATWLSSMQAPGALVVGRDLGELRAELAGGGAFSLTEHRGEILVLSFWATWCGPCKLEAPRLARIQREGTTVIGLAIDDAPLAKVADKAREIGMQYSVGKSPEGLAERLGISVVPTTTIIGRDGKVAASFRGLVDYGELARAVASAAKR